MAEEKGLQLAPGIDVTNVLVIILYLVLIVAAAYFLTKYVAKRSLRKGMKPKTGAGQGGFKRNEFEHMVSVVDRISIDRDKTMVVIEFQGKYYLLGTTAQGFEQIDKVDIPKRTEEAENAEPESEPGTIVANDTQKPGHGTSDTFWGRFKKCFFIVIKSYLPGRKNKNNTSFEEHLRKETDEEKHKTGKD